VDGDISAIDLGSGGQCPILGWTKVSGRVRICDLTALLAVEMDVLMEIGAVAGLPALQMNLLDEAVGGQVLQTVVNRGQ
jgi:hypothetical protein